MMINYNHDKSVDTGAQTMHYQTKDLDFGLPSQTKKLFKVYVTFKGNPANNPPNPIALTNPIPQDGHAGESITNKNPPEPETEEFISFNVFT